MLYSDIIKKYKHMKQINHLKAAENVTLIVHRRTKYISTMDIIGANPELEGLKPDSNDDWLIKMYFNKLRGGVKEDWKRFIKKGWVKKEIIDEVFGLVRK